MNIKSILLASVLIVVIVFCSGCMDKLTETLSGGDSGSSGKDTGEASEETRTIDAFLSDMSEMDVEFDSGTFSASDTDNDGKDDLYSHTFDVEEIAEGLSLERKVEYENTDDGLMGSLTLDFENTWGDDDTKSYTHIETIPKSFAENVDDLKFSVEPDRIVNPDPEVEWVIKGMINDITVEAKNDAVSAATGELLNQLGWWGMGMLATKINITALGNVISSGGTATERIDKLHEMIEGAGLNPIESAALDNAAETGMSVAVGTALEHFDDFKAIRMLAKCNRIYTSREEYVFCLMTVVAKYPNSFTKADCERLNFDDAPHLMSSSFASNAACKSIVSGRIDDCIQLFIADLDVSREMKEKQCRMQIFNFYSTACVNIVDPQTKKDCLFLSALESGSVDACKSKYAALDERQRKICLAMNTQNADYCREMKEEEDWKNCCELMNPDLKEDCLKKEECDSEHMSLCDNEKDCGGAGGYWYNSQCNEEEEKEDQKQDGCGGLGQECCSCDKSGPEGTKCNADGNGQRLTCDVSAKPNICVKCGGLSQKICSGYDNCGYNPSDASLKEKYEVESCDPGLKFCYDDSDKPVCMSCGCSNQKQCSEGTACFGSFELIKGYCVSSKCGSRKGLWGSRQCTSDEQCANECPWMTCLDNGYCSKP